MNDETYELAVLEISHLFFNSMLESFIKEDPYLTF